MTWRERIQAAREGGGFTDDDTYGAANWLSCAVGEQHHAMPTIIAYFEFEPKDRVLATFGVRFWKAVITNRYRNAERALDAIEDRALQLKREAQP